ncbi:hypothetical protein [Microbacterium maritypicum]|uniref:hypothetical protein n=1 Tax=Microbacterium maritypicum TaxID=33918 RepID=UPI003A94FD00
MTAPAGIADRAWTRALEYAHTNAIEIADAQSFADSYAAMVEDRMNEIRYPDVADPTPEEFYYS